MMAMLYFTIDALSSIPDSKLVMCTATCLPFKPVSKEVIVDNVIQTVRSVFNKDLSAFRSDLIKYADFSFEIEEENNHYTGCLHSPFGVHYYQS